jgi:sigma-B regulation protein RsbU (phosphoserine phosphatase)
MLFPMKGRNHIVGHVFLVGATKQDLPKHVRRYLGIAATEAGLIYDNMVLTDLRQSQLAVEKELQQARQIQMDLFPPSFDVHPRLDAYAVNLPSAQVSGDYYDIVRIDEDTVAFVIADAMGHGMPAALLMAAVRAALRMGLKLSLPWPSIFQGLDDLIRQARENTFVTGMIGRLRFSTQQLEIVSAGHPLPSILVDGQLRAVPEKCQTRPWGIDMHTEWEVGAMPLSGQRWSIIGYTDGITRRSYGAQRIYGYHQKHFHADAEDLCQGLLGEVSSQSDALLEDDQTVLVLCSK